MNENNQSQRSDEARKTKVFAISIGAILVLLSIAALAIVPSIKEQSLKSELASLKQQYNDLLSTKLRSSVDANITYRGHRKEELTKEELENLYDACQSELISTYDFDETRSTESLVSAYRSAIYSLEYRLDNNNICSTSITQAFQQSQSLYGGNGLLTSSQSASFSNGYIGDHVFGNVNSSIVFVEYSDYQCPGCASFQPYLDKIKQDYADDVLFISRNFPLTMHAKAKDAARAAEAAGALGSYWEMHTALFEHRADWINATDTEAAFVEIFENAHATGSVEDFKRLYENSSKYFNDIDNRISIHIDKKIESDIDSGKKAKISGTPSIFINGESFSFGDYSTFDQIDQAIREELDTLKAKRTIDNS